MIQQVFALRDRKADVFGRPVFVAALGSLVRELTDAVTGGGQDTLARHPGDFALYRLGTFDDVKGTFDLLPLPDFVLDCATLLPVRPVVSMPEGHAGSEASGDALPVAPARIA